MLNFLISFAFAILAAVPLRIVYGWDMIYCSLVSVVLFMLIYFLMSRNTMKKVTALVETAQKDMQNNRGEKAVATLKSGYKYAKWQFYVKGQLNAQIGTVLYIRKEFAKALPYLEKAFAKHWVAMCMLAVSYMKRNKPAKMTNAFEKAVAANRKEPFIWNLYAYCLDKIGEKKKAMEVLEKGIKKTKGDERLVASLKAVENNKRMKMDGYGDFWYQFHLEKTGAMVKKQTKAIQGRRKMPRM
ncbi:MAG: tetratricopeptide repeat protein [Desulfuromonadaceae bacterium]